jgi:4-amino-4-deoxy-L-arabinose transferase-like glycosyltransferase
MTRRSAAQGLLPLAGLVVFVALAVTSLRTRAATFDEGVYISAGYSHLVTGDYRLLPIHPPLSKLLAAAPLVLAGARADFDDASWLEADSWDFAHRFLYRWNDADRILWLARLPIVGLAALLAGAVFAWTREHWGLAPALLALVLCVFSPEMLAHGALATSDLAVAFCVFVAVVAFEQLTGRATWPRLVGAGLAAGGAFVAKFSGLVLVPILLGLALWVALGPWPLRLDLRGWPGGPQVVATRRARSLHVAGLLAVMAVVSVAVIWAAHGFRYRAVREDAAPVGLAWSSVTLEGPAAAAARFVRDRQLLPEAYVFGFVDTLRRSQGRPAFLMGGHSPQGWWYFFPAAFALKTPLALPVLLLLAWAAGARGAASPRTVGFLWVPVAVYVVFCLSSHVNLGLRYLLPVYPFLFVAAGRAAGLLARGRAWTAVTIALAAWYAASTLRVHPYHLAYFNELAGGPRNGYRHLVDSSLDWGQDLKGLKPFLDRRRISRIKLSYFGTADPAYYGIPCDYLPGSMRPAPPRLVHFVRPGDVVVVSATNLQGVYLPRAMRGLMDRLRALSPVATVGYSLFVYRPDFTWFLPPTDADALGWLEQATESYAEAARFDPGLAEAHGHLGLAWQLRGRNRQSVAAFEEALRLDPAYLDSRPDHRRAWDAARSALARPRRLRSPSHP